MARRPVLAFQYEAYPRLPFHGALQLARERVDAGGGRVVDIGTFSNKSIVFQVAVHRDDLPSLASCLRDPALRLAEPPAPPDPALAADADGDVLGTLTLYLTGNDPDRSDSVPAVPG